MKRCIVSLGQCLPCLLWHAVIAAFFTSMIIYEEKTFVDCIYKSFQMICTLLFVKCLLTLAAQSSSERHSKGFRIKLMPGYLISLKSAVILIVWTFAVAVLIICVAKLRI